MNALSKRRAFARGRPEGREMDQPPKLPAVHAGLRCRNCGTQRFRVIYTRAAPGGKIIRRRACRECGRRMTTWERMIGG
jgi:hypothetical protein